MASNVLGVSGLALLRALIEGQLTPAEMAQLARGRLRSKHAELEAALTGVMTDHQRFLLASLLRQVDFHDQEIAALATEIEKRLESHDELLDRLDEIPGIGRTTAEHLIAEITTDMRRFPTANHLASWAKVCPGNHESGGKRLSDKTGKGSRWIRAILVEAAHAAARARGTYLAQMYQRIAARRGKKRAAIAVAHAILIIIYHMIKRATRYQDLGVDHHDKQREAQIVRNATRRIRKLGYHVTLQPVA